MKDKKNKIIHYNYIYYIIIYFNTLWKGEKPIKKLIIVSKFT